MSASLVGSEMCIRDRSASPLRGLRHLRRSPPENSEIPELRVVGSQRTRTVSYTHLTLPTICSV
eukprot:1210249-Alexandrium_andersonii.AAC.1